MLFAQLAALVLMAGTLAVSGCGESSSSKRLTKAEIAVKANAICARFFVELHAHGTKSRAELTSNVQLLAVNRQVETDALRKLTPPASMAADWGAILAADQTLANDSTKFVGYAKEGKLSAASALLTTTIGIQARAVAIARRDGIRECARLT
jgi:hypothetical protein